MAAWYAVTARGIHLQNSPDCLPSRANASWPQSARTVLVHPPLTDTRSRAPSPLTCLLLVLPPNAVTHLNLPSSRASNVVELYRRFLDSPHGEFYIRLRSARRRLGASPSATPYRPALTQSLPTLANGAGRRLGTKSLRPYLSSRALKSARVLVIAPFSISLSLSPLSLPSAPAQL